MKLKSCRGAELVEMALVMPLLLILIFGMVDFGLALFDKAVITNAAREGARAAVVFRNPALDPTTPQQAATAAATAYCSTYLISFGSSTPAVIVATSPLPGNTEAVAVTVNYTYDYVTMGTWLGFPPLGMQGRAVMRRE